LKAFIDRAKLRRPQNNREFMILIVGTIRLASDDHRKAAIAMTAMITASRAEKGCLEYSYAADILDPGLIHVKEIWTDRASLHAHFQSDHLRAWRSSWEELQIGERRLALYNVAEPEAI
jgi:quinol monooxygenase YgiN